jgi:hypothetical protein
MEETMGMLASVYRSDLDDCSNGGVSSKHTQVCVTNVPGPYEPTKSMTAGSLLRITRRLVLPLLFALWVTSAGNAQSQSATTEELKPDELFQKLHEECVESRGMHGAIAGCLLEKEEAYGKELDQ